VDPALNKNEPEFRVLVLPVPLKMLPNRHRLLNEEVEILRDLRRQPYTHTSDSINTPHFRRRTYESSKQSHKFSPWALRMRRILLPVTLLTRGIPCWSRSRTPICDGIWPFFAALVIISSTCHSTSCERVNQRQSTNRNAQIEPLRNEGGKQTTSVVAILSQVGGVLLYGSADDEIPFLRHRDTHMPLEHTEFTGEQH